MREEGIVGKDPETEGLEWVDGRAGGRVERSVEKDTSTAYL